MSIAFARANNVITEIMHSTTRAVYDFKKNNTSNINDMKIN